MPLQKSIEIIRSDLLLEIRDATYPDIAPIHIPDKWVASSLLQKAIRRGQSDYALAAANFLHQLDPRIVWRRLSLIGWEDVSVGDVEACCAASELALDSKMRCYPNIMAFSKFYGKLTKRLCEFHGAGSTEEKLLEEAVKYGKAWRYSFPLWKPNEAGLELFAAILEMIFWEMVGASFQQVMSPKIAHTISKWNQAAKNGN